MANRVLNRPMFSMGGTPRHEFQEQTSGILSGLDGPKLNASRTGLANGGLTMEDFKKDVLNQAEMRREIYGEDDYKASAGMPGSASSALMNFGLNLLAQPGGNLFGSIGKAGAPVLRQFQSAREAERLDKRKTEREMRRDALDRAFDLREAEIEADAEIKSEMGKHNRFAFEATQDTMKKLQDDEKGLIKEISDLEKKQTEGTITDEEIVILEEKKTDKSNNEELQILITKEKKTDPVAEAILKGVANGVFTFEDYKAYKESGEYPQGFSAGKKDGGRAGYQMGGEVVEDVATMSETATMSPTAPAQTQDLTYDELRSRLPREITNDVVSLIATSKAALTDFANIQTQQDVDNFNQTYNVNLVLPQEG